MGTVQRVILFYKSLCMERDELNMFKNYFFPHRYFFGNLVRLSQSDRHKHLPYSLDSATREVFGPRMYVKKPWVSQATLSIIDQRRKVMRRKPFSRV